MTDEYIKSIILNAYLTIAIGHYHQFDYFIKYFINSHADNQENQYSDVFAFLNDSVEFMSFELRTDLNENSYTLTITFILQGLRGEFIKEMSTADIITDKSETNFQCNVRKLILITLLKLFNCYHLIEEVEKIDILRFLSDEVNSIKNIFYQFDKIESSLENDKNFQIERVKI